MVPRAKMEEYQVKKPSELLLLFVLLKDLEVSGRPLRLFWPYIRDIGWKRTCSNGLLNHYGYLQRPAKMLKVKCHDFSNDGESLSLRPWASSVLLESESVDVVMPMRIAINDIFFFLFVYK